MRADANRLEDIAVWLYTAPSEYAAAGQLLQLAVNMSERVFSGHQFLLHMIPYFHGDDDRDENVSGSYSCSDIDDTNEANTSGQSWVATTFHTQNISTRIHLIRRPLILPAETLLIDLVRQQKTAPVFDSHEQPRNTTDRNCLQGNHR